MIADMKRNVMIHKNHRRWNPQTLAILSIFFLISYTDFDKIRKVIVLPSNESMYNYINSRKALDIEKITNIKRLNETLLEYRKENNIDPGDVVPGVLAVDRHLGKSQNHRVN